MASGTTGAPWNIPFPRGADDYALTGDLQTMASQIATQLGNVARPRVYTVDGPIANFDALPLGLHSFRNTDYARDSGLPEPNNGMLMVNADDYQRVLEWAPTVGEPAVWRNAKASGGDWTGWVKLGLGDLQARLLAPGERAENVGTGVYGVLWDRNNPTLPPGLSGALTEWPTGDSTWTQLWQTWNQNGAIDLLARSQSTARTQVWQRPESPRAADWARQEIAALQASMTAPRADGSVPSSAWSATAATIPMLVPTPDGTGQATHPSVVDVPGRWNGHRYWMAYTPYAYANDALEDPCVAWSDNGAAWTKVDSAFPLDDAPGGSDYNSDTHAVLHNGTMYVTWRRVTTTGTIFYLRKSTDGQTWTPRQTLWNTGGMSAFSQALVKTATGWRMWFVGGAAGARKLGYIDTTATSPTSGWGSPNWASTPTPAGREPWHVDVHLHAGRWWGVLTDTTLGQNGVACQVRLMQSSDGDTWDVSPTQLIPHLGHSHDVLYKTAATFSGNALRPTISLWYSGLSADKGWWLYRRPSVTLHAPADDWSAAITALNAAAT